MNMNKIMSSILCLIYLTSFNINKSLTDTNCSTIYENDQIIEKSESVRSKILKKIAITAGLAAAFRLGKYIYNGEYYWDNIEDSTDKNIFQNIEDGDVVISFMNIGSGDCTLIQTKEKSTLIDCGWTGFNFSGVTNPVHYLNDIGIKKIDNIIMTHDHIDHQGMLPAVLESFECKNFYYGYSTKEIGKKEYIPFGERNIYSLGADKLYNCILNSKITKHKLKGNRKKKINLGKNVYLTIYCPKISADINDNSLISVLEVGDKKAIFVGDQGVEAERRLINNPNMRDLVKNCDILKVGHHGDSSSSCEEFIRHVDPNFAVISTGIHVTMLLGQLHCQRSVCKRIKKLTREDENKGERKLFVTQSNGNIVCKISKGGISFSKNSFGKEYNAFSRTSHSTLRGNKERYSYSNELVNVKV